MWQGYRLRELRGVVWAWPCSFSFNRLPALVPLKQPPLTSFGGRGRGYRGGKLGPEGGERAPAAAAGLRDWLGLSLKREVKD